MQKAKNKLFTCEYCDKEFSKESTLFAHLCVKKQRFLDKDNKNSVVAFMAFRRFFELSGMRKSDKSFKGFIDSVMYNDFMCFGKWINDALVINPQGYVDYLIRGNFKIKDWTKESTYQTYLKTFLFHESPMAGIERSIMCIQTWSEETNTPLESFFEAISTNRAVDLLRNGRISPWIFIICENSIKLLNRLDVSQYKLLGDLMDSKIWTLKIKKHQAEVLECEEIIEGLGL